MFACAWESRLTARFLRLVYIRIFTMPSYSPEPDEDYGDEYEWWDEWEKELDEELEDG